MRTGECLLWHNCRPLLFPIQNLEKSKSQSIVYFGFFNSVNGSKNPQWLLRMKFYLFVEEKVTGPFDFDDLCRKWERHEISSETLFCQELSRQWQRIETIVPEFELSKEAISIPNERYENVKFEKRNKRAALGLTVFCICGLFGWMILSNKAIPQSVRAIGPVDSKVGGESQPSPRPDSPGSSSGRFALVIGVDNYKFLPPDQQLEVAVSDARLMADTLKKAVPPFDTILLTDVTQNNAESVFDQFISKAEDSDCALIYFAGHGVEYHGENFLLVSDTAVSRVSDDVRRMKRRLGNEAIALQAMLDDLDATRARVKLVVLDCCRDNPLESASSETRSLIGSPGGLARVTPPSGTLISYSADVGQKAIDGLFTGVLTKNMATPGLTIMKVFASTRMEVRETSRRIAKENSRISSHEPAEYNKLDPAGLEFAFVESVKDNQKRERINGQSNLVSLQQKISKLEAALAAKESDNSENLEPKNVTEVAKTNNTSKSGGSDLPKFPEAPNSSVSLSSRDMTGNRAGEVRAFKGIDMIWCPAGTFLMGSPANEPLRDSNERKHRVTLTKGFWIAKTETTQVLWESVMRGNPSSTKGTDLPVESVSWHDALGFCKKLNLMSKLPNGWQWSLPTEAQWEYACRAGTMEAFAGNLRSIGWFDDYGGERLQSVGTKDPNPWGIHDMHGNVQEWCHDWYSSNSYTDGERDPEGPPSGVYRVHRGGSWRNFAQYCRSADRDNALPDSRSGAHGFRVVLKSGN